MARDTGQVVGIDIGTSKVATVVGKVAADGGIEIVGMGRSDSRGMRKGIVVNLEEAVEAVKASVEEAERMAGHPVEKALVAVGGCHVRGYNSRGVVAVTGRDRQISKDDVQRVMDASRTISFPQDQQIFDTVPQEYKVDDQDGISQPVGMTGMRLEADVHIITGSTTSLKNIGEVVNRCGILVEAPVLGLWADAMAVLPADERELGVALINIGHGTTGIAVFEKGAIWHTHVIPIGGELFTNDLAVGLRTGIQEAELLKKKHGCALTSLIQEDETVEVQSIATKKAGVVPRSRLAEILQPRAEELFQLVYDEVRSAGLEKTLNAGIVLTGGGSHLPGLCEVAEGIFDHQTRVGEPLGVQGLTALVGSADYATAVGMVVYGSHQRGRDGAGRPGGSGLGKVVGWFKDLF
jgi:cell division protein FtsA